MNIVVLDRDGVINHDSDNYIRSHSEWLPIDGSIEAIAQLTRSGFRVFVATNQSGLARRYFDREELSAMHDKMHALVGEAGGKIERVFFCPHHPDDQCSCRKPATGLLDQLEAYLGHSVEGVWFVGDSITDVEAAVAKQCTPIVVLTGKGRKTAEAITAKAEAFGDIPVHANLLAASQFIIEQNAQSTCEAE